MPVTFLFQDNADVCLSSQKDDELNDCIAALGGLAIANDSVQLKNCALKPPATPAYLDENSVENTHLYHRLSAGNSFCVIDWGSDGQPIEHTLRFLPKAGNSDEPKKPSPLITPGQSCPITTFPKTSHNDDATAASCNTSSTISDADQIAEKSLVLPSNTSSLDVQVERNVESPQDTPAVLLHLPDERIIADNSQSDEGTQPSSAIASTASSTSISFNTIPSAIPLPHYESNTTSINSTPFLTPEGDTLYSDFDPLNPKTAGSLETVSMLQDLHEKEGDSCEASESVTGNNDLYVAGTVAKGVEADTKTEEAFCTQPQFDGDHVGEIGNIQHFNNINKTCNVAASKEDVKHEADTSYVSSGAIMNLAAGDNCSVSVLSHNTIAGSDLCQIGNPDFRSARPESTANSVENSNDCNAVADATVKESSEDDDIVAMFSGMTLSSVEATKFVPHTTKKNLMKNVITNVHEAKSTVGYDNVSEQDAISEKNTSVQNNHTGDKVAHKAAGRSNALPDNDLRMTTNFSTNSETKEECFASPLEKETHTVCFNKNEQHLYDNADSAEICSESVVADLHSLETSQSALIANTDCGKPTKSFQVGEPTETVGPAATASVLTDGMQEPPSSPPLQHGKYSIDFLQLDDPDFNPFKTNKGLANSPVKNCPENSFSDSPCEETVEGSHQTGVGQKPGDVLQVSQNLADTLCTETESSVTESSQTGMTVVSKIIGAPKEANKIVTDFGANSPSSSKTAEPEVGFIKVSDPQQNLPSEEDVLINTKPDHVLITSGSCEESFTVFKVSPNKTMTLSSNSDACYEEDESDAPPKPGAYSLDFSKFDDPNFDPFKTNKGLSTSPVKDTRSETLHQMYVVEQDVPAANREDPKVNASSKQYETVVQSQDFQEAKPKQDELTGNALDSDELVNKASPRPLGCNTDDDINFDSLKSDVKKTNSFTNTTGNAFVDSNQPEANEKPEMKLHQDVEKPVKIKVGLSKKRVKKKKPRKASSGERDAEEVVDNLPGHGAYSIDFSKFDDPDFNPFKTSKEISLSPSEEIKHLSHSVNDADSSQNQSLANTETVKTEQNVEVVPDDSDPVQNRDEFSVTNNDDKVEGTINVRGCHSSDTVKLEDPISDPFKTSEELGNSPTKEVCLFGGDQESFETNIAPVQTDPENLTTDSKSDKVVASKELTRPAATLSTSNDLVEDERDALPKPGAYSLDFRKFDDPNFDPFKTTQGLSNSPVKDTSRETFRPDDFIKGEVPENNVLGKDHEAFVKSQEFNEMNSLQGGECVVSKSDEPCHINISCSPERSTNSNADFVMVSSAERKVTENTANVTPNEPESGEKASEMKLDQDVKNPAKSTVGLSKKRFKKKKPWKDSSGERNDEETRDILPKPGAYAIDFSKFDDPNFDPFKTSKEISLSPTKDVKLLSHLVNDSDVSQKQDRVAAEANDRKQNVEDDVDNFAGFEFANKDDQVKKVTNTSAVPGSCSADAGQLGDSTYSTDDSLGSSPTTEVALCDDEQQTVKPNSAPNEKAPKKNSKDSKRKKFGPSKKLGKPAAPSSACNDNADENECDALPKPGAYSFDFSKFDDPNFDPFKSNKGLSNSPTEEAPSETLHPLGGVKQDVPAAIHEDRKGSTSYPQHETCVKPQDFKKIEPMEGEQRDGVINCDEVVYNDGACPIDLKSDVEESNSITINTTGNAFVDSNQPEANEKPSEMKLDQDVEKPVKPKVGLSKKRVKKKKPWKASSSERDAAEVVDNLPGHGAYSIDFSKFDDPNFDPFKTSIEISLSPSEEIKHLSHSVNDVDSSQNQSLAKTETVETEQNVEVVPDYSDPVRNNDNKEEPDASVIRGSYSMDLTNLEDPTFDPFKTTKALRNSPTKEVTSTGNDEELGEANSVPTKNAQQKIPKKSKLKKFAPKKKLGKTVVSCSSETAISEQEQQETLPEPGAYSLDFSKFDDPNFNPFKTSTDLVNSPTKNKPSNDGLKASAPSPVFATENAAQLGAVVDLDSDGNPDGCTALSGQFSDPSLDPFRSNKRLANSPDHRQEVTPHPPSTTASSDDGDLFFDAASHNSTPDNNSTTSEKQANDLDDTFSVAHSQVPLLTDL